MRQRLRRLSLCLCVPSCLLLAIPGALSGQAQDREVEEEGSVDVEITVSETSLLLDFGGLLTQRQVRNLQPGGIRIAEADVPRESVRLEPVIAEPDDRWQVLVYFDLALSTTQTVRQGAFALGDAASDLARMADVRVVAADDDLPTEILRPTRSVTELQDTFAQIAKQTEGFDRLNGLRQRYAATLARGDGDDLVSRLEALDQEVGLIRRFGDRLLRLLGDGCSAQACALFLVTDGFEVHPELYYLGQAWSTTHPEVGRQAEKTASDLAESLSALEWVTVVLPLRPEPTPTSGTQPRGADPSSDYDFFARNAGGAHFEGIKLTRRRSKIDDLPIESFEVYLLPSLTSMRMLADETSGAILRRPEQIDGTLRSLASRWRVWYRTTRPIDGRIRPVDAYLVQAGKPVRAPLWVDASTPEGVASARARGVLERQRVDGDLDLRVEPLGEPGDESRRLRVEIDWGEEAPTHLSGPSVPLRVSVAFSTPDEPIEVHHQILEIPAQPNEPETVHEIEAPVPGDAEEVAVVVEDLRFRVWGTGRLAASR